MEGLVHVVDLAVGQDDEDLVGGGGRGFGLLGDFKGLGEDRGKVGWPGKLDVGDGVGIQFFEVGH